jgi:hypothetical protein
MEAAGYSEASVHIYQITFRNIAEDRILKREKSFPVIYLHDIPSRR